MAKTFERRRCGHHPDEYPEPLSTNECMASVVDPKQNGENKHRYVVASQAQDVRRMLRGVRAVPLIYIKRSVMILEPMADDAVQVRAREERAKFRAELKQPQLGKRKREGDDEKAEPAAAAEGDGPKKKKKTYAPGAKQPNPLSVKKTKKKEDKPEEVTKKEATPKKIEVEKQDMEEDGGDDAEAKKSTKKRKRGKRKPKTADANGDAAAEGGDNEADDE